MSDTRAWLKTLADPKILSALHEAVRSCTRDGCAHDHYDDSGALTEDPDYCTCRENLMLPAEFEAWLTGEIAINRGKPVRFEQGYAPRSAPRRELHLITAAG